MKRLFSSSLSAILLLVLTLCLQGCDGQPVPRNFAASLHESIDGQRALDHVAALVAFGPRPAGSEPIERSRQYIESHLISFGWNVQRQTFEKKTPRGKVSFTNLRARFGEASWRQDVTGILCSHYDTKPYDTLTFVGANDGGSSTGLLLELAQVLAQNPKLASGIELVFFDGEEAFGTNITASDGLYGSRYYAAEWNRQPIKRRPRWGLLLDMVGDASLNVRAAVNLPPQSIRELSAAKEKGDYAIDIADVQEKLRNLGRELLGAAQDLGHRREIGVGADYIIDDHVPLSVIAGIPTIDIIDFDYPSWHTPADTLDKISADSLAIVGKVTLYLIESRLRRN